MLLSIVLVARRTLTRTILWSPCRGGGPRLPPGDMFINQVYRVGSNLGFGAESRLRQK